MKKTEQVPSDDMVNMWKTVVQYDTAMADTLGGKTIAPNKPIETFKRKQLMGDLPRIEPGGESSEFEVQHTLGEGGMGLVRLARQSSLHREVAIKTIRPEQLGPEATHDLLQESWVTGMLEHPNIVPIHALGLDEHGAPMMVMKRVEGVSWMDAMLDEDKLPAAFRGGRDSLSAHIDILVQVCNAVEFAHSKGVIHCDLKPENVMLGSYGEVYLVDWGIAVSIEGDGTGRLPLASDLDTLAGTPAYIAPELAAGEGHRIGPHTDIYLLGAVLHELVTGEARHKGGSVMAMLTNAYRSAPVEYDASVPAELAEICNRATRAQPEERYASVGAFRQALVEFEEHRDSLRLSQKAERRLERLERLIAAIVKSDETGVDDNWVTEINALFNECRFGFEQSLEIWNGNARARRGLRRAIIWMVEFELSQRNDKAVAVLLEALPTVPEKLQKRLDDLRADLAREAEEIERNRQISQDVDIDMASSQRSRMFVLFGFIFGAMPILNQWAIDQGWATLTFQDYFIQYALVLTAAILVVIPMRAKLTQNSINARFIQSVFATLAGLGVVRVLGLMLGLDPGGCIALENGFLAFSVGMMALAFDRRLWATPLPFLAGAFVGAWNLDWILYADGISNALALWLFAFAWREPSREPVSATD
ncbi:MAG: serine/threonine-protein kinase [Myxococcota bacterium]